MDSTISLASTVHCFSVACSACGIVLVALESPLDASSVVLIVLFSLFILEDGALFGIWYTGVWDKWRDQALRANSVVGVALLGVDPTEPLPVLNAARMELYAQAEELRLYAGLTLGFVMVTILMGVDAAPSVRDVNGGVAATLATFACLGAILWAALARFALEYTLAVDALFVSGAGLALFAVVTSEARTSPLVFSLAWTFSCIGAVGVRFAVVYAAGVQKSQPSLRRMGPLVFVSAHIFLWGLLVSSTGYVIFNPGLLAASGILVVFFALEFFLASASAWTSSAASFLGGERPIPQANTQSALTALRKPFTTESIPVVAVAGLWGSTLIIILILALVSVFANAPAPVGWCLWALCVANALLGFFTLFRNPLKPKHALVASLSIVVVGACLCAAPVTGQGLAAPLVLVFLWLLMVLAAFVPDLLKPENLSDPYEALAELTQNLSPVSTPRGFTKIMQKLLGEHHVEKLSEEAQTEFPDHAVRAFRFLLVEAAVKAINPETPRAKDFRVSAGLVLGCLLLAGLLGFCIAMAAGRPVLSMFTAAFAALLTWTLVYALLGLVAGVVFAQRLSATLGLKNLVARGPSPEKKSA